MGKKNPQVLVIPIKTFLEVHRGNSVVNSKDRKYMSRLTCFDTSVSLWRLLIYHSLWKAAVKMRQHAGSGSGSRDTG